MKLDSVFSALSEFEDRTRQARVDRIVWLADHNHLPSLIAGRAETLHVLREAREVFINGHYAATLMLGMAVVEHSLVEELQLRGLIDVGKSPAFARLLSIAEKAAVLPADWFAPIRLLSYRRNPIAHLKDEKHEHGLRARVRAEKTHPNHLLEQDAREAVKWMYKVFRATLREAD